MAWSKGIKDILKANCTSFKELEKMIGRLVHLGTVLPQIHQFMSRLRELLRRAKNRRSMTLPEAVVDDLKLMLSFLSEAAAGIDMNLLVYRRPTKIYRSDSCPAGLGGYSCDGFAWRFYIPKDKGVIRVDTMAARI